MKMIRMYTGEDGITHLVDMDPSELKLEVKEMTIKNQPAKLPSDWHNARAHRVLIIRSGRVKVEVEDGSTRILEAGDLVLEEDLTGKGHRGLKLDENPVVINSVALA